MVNANRAVDKTTSNMLLRTDQIADLPLIELYICQFTPVVIVLGKTHMTCPGAEQYFL